MGATSRWRPACVRMGPGMLHGQDREELLPERDAALPERPDAAEHPLSGWAINALANAGIRTVGELAERSAEELLALPNFGADSLRRTETFLAGVGMSLSARPSARRAARPSGSRIDPEVEERLRSAGLWEARMPGGLVAGTRLRDLLRAPGVTGLEELDKLLSGLCSRGMLPKPRGMNELLTLLAASEGARRATEAADRRLSRPTPGDVVGGDAASAALDATGTLLDAGEEEISRGTLHERALLDWPPLANANARLTPEERTLPGLLGILVRLPGRGLPAEEAVRATEALVSYPTLDDELRALLRDVVALDGRKRLVMLGCFSREGHLKLRELGERFGVSRERIRQLKVGLARDLRRAHAGMPLPRLRTAAEIAAELLIEDRLRRGSEPGGIPEHKVHAELESRGLARSAEATRHGLAVLGAISYARELDGASPTQGIGAARGLTRRWLPAASSRSRGA